jgi:hypothetical protein
MSKRGEHYLHEFADVRKCLDGCDKSLLRTVECCPSRLPPETDILECSACGRTFMGRCNFDEDMS